MNVNLRLFSLGVGLASLATIALELLLTRIYSVTMYYHFAFMVVSLALLGLSVSGVAIYLFPRAFARRGPAALGAGFMILFAIGAVIAVRTALANPVSVHSFSSNPGKLVVVYFAASLPFLFSGFALSLAIVAAGAHIGRIYAFDLGGAALGCVALIPVVGALGAPGAALGIAALGAFAAAILALADNAGERDPSRGRRPSLRHATAGLATALAVVLLVLAIGESKAHRLGLARNPEKFQGSRPVLFEKWNAFSQITVTPSADLDHRWIFIDGDAATRMWSGEARTRNPEAPRRIPEVRVASLAYAIRHTGTALIIGPGGGTDVLSALSRGVPRVVGVEVNPIIVNDVMRDRFASWNGDLYRDPRVRVVVDEGRSFIRRADQRFGTIQATLVDTWAASSSGAFTLSENNIYTTEAFTEFLDHLEPGGVLTVTRWYDATAPKEFLRLLALARAAVERHGTPAAEAHRHVVVATDHERRGTLLLGRDPFTSADLATLRATAERDRLRLLFAPDQAPGAASEDPLLARFLRAPNAADVLDELPYDARATTDDRPFFFYSLRRSELLSALGRFGRLEANNVGIAILLLLLAFSLGTTVLLVALPMLALRRAALREQTRAKLRVLAYFLGLGLGYILIEIGFMQKFVLFLGHPIYALAVVLATLLAASGAGSALSGRWVSRFGSRRAVQAIVAALSVVLIGYAVGLAPLFRQMLGLPIGGRIALAALLIALPGLLMGALLPIGVRAANLVARDLVAWGWGLNGAASVVGSIAAVTLSMNFGFSAALLAGLAIYAAAAVALPSLPQAT